MLAIRSRSKANNEMDVCALCEHNMAQEDIAALRAEIHGRAQETADLRAQLDRVTDLFEAWAAEENEHRKAGEYGIAEGLGIASDSLRGAVHGEGI